MGHFVLSSLSIMISLTLVSTPVLADVFPGYWSSVNQEIRINDDSPSLGTKKEGLRNTLLSQIMAGPTGTAIEVKFKKPHPQQYMFDTNEIPEFERTCFFNLKRQEKFENNAGKTHLVYVIPGFGSNKDEGAASYISEILHREGLVTLSSHSPAHPDFIEFSSSVGIPGSQRFEGFDLYQCLEEGVKKLNEDYGYEFEKISVVGASLGSMNAFRLAYIDLRNKKDGKPHFDFYRVFSLNPPISNVYGSSTIDTMVGLTLGSFFDADMGKKIDAFVSALLDVVPSVLKRGSFEDVKKLSLEAQAAMASSDRLSAGELKFLVGIGFGPTVAKSMEAGRRRYAPQTSPTDRMADIPLFTGFLQRVTYSNWRAYGLSNPHTSEYNDKYVYPASQNHLEGLTVPHFVMTERESIGHMIPELQEQGFDLSHYHLVTWSDDFLLRDSDPAWIESTLTGGVKGNSKVYRNGGGHLGGYWQDSPGEFQDYLKQNIK